MVIIMAVLGLLFGSFINAWVWRLHLRQSHIANRSSQDIPKKRNAQSEERLSIVRGRSMCPECHHELAALDLIPVVSWLMLRGRCRYCRKPISLQYPLVELATAGLFALSYLALRPSLQGQSLQTSIGFAVWLFILTSLIALAVYDLRWMLLPDVILVPVMAVAALWLGLQLLLGAPFWVLAGPVIAAVVAGGGFYLLAAVSKGRWMGGGDIKLAFAMGLILGLRKLGVALFVGFDSAALVGLALLATRVKKRSEYIPFGPFLVVGTIVAMLYGQAIIDWYLKINGL